MIGREDERRRRQDEGGQSEGGGNYREEGHKGRREIRRGGLRGVFSDFVRMDE